MRRKHLAVVLLAALAASSAGTPAWAADVAKLPQDQTLKLSPLAVPVVVDRQVINYIFVQVRLILSPSADVTALRDKEPYFRDALIRAAYRTPFGVAANPNRIDEGKLKAALMRDAAAIAGPGTVQAVKVENQSPKHRLAIGKPSATAPSVQALETP